MAKISEIPFTPENQVVSKVLVHLHKAIDQHFPDTENLQKRFSKTVFSGEGESTAIDRRPTEEPARAETQKSNSQLYETKLPSQFDQPIQTTKLHVMRSRLNKSLWIMLIIGVLFCVGFILFDIFG